MQAQIRALSNGNLDVHMIFMNFAAFVFYNCIAVLMYKYKDIKC
ncbi:hypothetical protein CLTEP_20070 [Clostridium tepidiprofundi DSM 19306]|uniref:Uncharacterized protein n=1 Tax=Clostridium tepidiprofundi DSM 19306 TaxID=1121338 RepID=A0A151B2B5_9CLOT|nr:hypothetical protein CLTEP_20070 [Clostridium tepidiprofundi DSM 19306]